MKKDTYITEVIFRVDTTKDFKETVFALLPYEVEKSGSVTCYQHIGQHSSADYYWNIQRSKPATEDEYKDLKAEMEQLGYNLKLIKQRNYNKYLTSINSLK